MTKLLITLGASQTVTKLQQLHVKQYNYKLCEHKCMQACSYVHITYKYNEHNIHNEIIHGAMYI